jgi:hypothetical protein
MLDENEFLGPFGIRSLSKYHEEHPFVFHVQGQEYRVDYLPAESNTGMFGGNSNWRGPVWMPVNVMIIRALLNFYLYYGDSFKIECPTGPGRMLNLFEVAKEISDRLAGIFLRDAQGRRPFYGGTLGLTRFGGSGDSEVRFSLAGGGGVKLMPSRHLGMRLDGRVYAVFVDGDATTGVCTPGVCVIGLDVSVVWQAEFTAGLVVSF